MFESRVLQPLESTSPVRTCHPSPAWSLCLLTAVALDSHVLCHSIARHFVCYLAMEPEPTTTGSSLYLGDGKINYLISVSFCEEVVTMLFHWHVVCRVE